MAMSVMKVKWCILFDVETQPLARISREELESQAGKDVLSWMQREELIDHDLKPLKRLRVFVDHLRTLNLPKLTWTMDGN